MKDGKRSETDKEKTKLRERQRRAITTKIFDGLRKRGGYRLSPRADINEVLRKLASEAGWVVDPDGTTYRSIQGVNCCHVCGSTKSNTSGTPTPTSSIIIGGDTLGGDPITTLHNNNNNDSNNFNCVSGEISYARLYDFSGEGTSSMPHLASSSSGTIVDSAPCHYDQR